MEIHNQDHEIFFSMPHYAKSLLHDSVTRTQSGIDNVKKGTYQSIALGSANFLLARVESAAACALELLSIPMPLTLTSLVTPCFLVPAVVLDLGSRLPWISSFKCVQKFTRECDNLIYRTIRVNLLAIPVITLSLATSFLNTFIPLQQENCLFEAMHWMVSSLGPLKTVEVSVPGHSGTHFGTLKPLSFIEGAEEFLRAHSVKNYPEPLSTSHLTYTKIYSI
jgi:hypothetical protein